MLAMRRTSEHSAEATRARHDEERDTAIRAGAVVIRARGAAVGAMEGIGRGGELGNHHDGPAAASGPRPRAPAADVVAGVTTGAGDNHAFYFYFFEGPRSSVCCFGFFRVPEAEGAYSSR